MYKGIALLYVACLAFYILYSREPDYFDGEISNAVIHWQADSTNLLIPKAVFKHGAEEFAVDARYVLRTLPENKKVQVIYMVSKPEKAVVYSWWGYWITWREVLGSFVLLVALFQVAAAVTNRPTPESLLEQMNTKKEKRRKYDV
ncbi:MAG: hypothetical protein KF781_11090 [Chitinophagaceae bacterium]|nr:hypothetical protein [Chitinophagaceae bacterium]MCW5906207.1 hypothetical protein [Chitinophagaceae bacterium]